MRNRKVIRMKGYDYRKPGLYFVTICTKNMLHYFGEVIDGKMALNGFGKFVYEHLSKIKNHYNFVDVLEKVVMPNHVHFILKINSGRRDEFLFIHKEKDIKKDTKNCARTSGLLNDFMCKSGSLGSIIRGFKIGVKKYANQNKIDFMWHKSFYDHIIKNKEAYNNIKYYIKNNPKNWKEDRYN